MPTELTAIVLGCFPIVHRLVPAVWASIPFLGHWVASLQLYFPYGGGIRPFPGEPLGRCLRILLRSEVDVPLRSVRPPDTPCPVRSHSNESVFWLWSYHVHLLYQGRDPVHGSLDLALALGTLSLLHTLAFLPSGHVVLPPSFFLLPS